MEVDYPGPMPTTLGGLLVFLMSFGWMMFVFSMEDSPQQLVRFNHDGELMHCSAWYQRDRNLLDFLTGKRLRDPEQLTFSCSRLHQQAPPDMPTRVERRIGFTAITIEQENRVPRCARLTIPDGVRRACLEP